MYSEEAGCDDHLIFSVGTVGEIAMGFLLCRFAAQKCSESGMFDTDRM